MFDTISPLTQAGNASILDKPLQDVLQMFCFSVTTFLNAATFARNVSFNRTI